MHSKSMVFTSDASTDVSTSASIRMFISPWKRPQCKHKHKRKHKHKDKKFSLSCACACSAFVFTWHKAVMLVLVFASLVKTKCLYPPFAIEILRYGTRDHTGNFFLKTSWQEQIHIWLTRYSGLFIFPISLGLHYSRSYRKLLSQNVMTRRRLHIWLRSRTEHNIIVEDKK